jgi:hypothetical protein
VDTHLQRLQASGEAVRIGSVDVLDALRREHPDVEWSWILGTEKEDKVS